jgi:m7GpppX diphosphatase
MKVRASATSLLSTSNIQSQKDPLSHSISILGTLPERDQPEKRTPTIIQVTKTPINAEEIASAQGVFSKLETIAQNDIYHWVLGWLGEKRSPDVKITVVENATEVHIRKVCYYTYTMLIAQLIYSLL